MNKMHSYRNYKHFDLSSFILIRQLKIVLVNLDASKRECTIFRTSLQETFNQKTFLRLLRSVNAKMPNVFREQTRLLYNKAINLKNIYCP